MELRHTLAITALVALGAGCAGTLSTHTGPAVGPPEAVAVASVEISFFGVPLGGASDVVFVLDRSGSMGGVNTGVSGQSMGMSKTGAILSSIGGTVANKAAGNPLASKMEVARSELIATLRALPDGTRFGVIFFGSDIAALSRVMWTLGPDTRQRAIAFIRGIEPKGGTAAVPAMQLAYQMGARRVVLLSDGLANRGGSGGDLLADARARHVRVDTVGLGFDRDDDVLVTMARETGGLAIMR